MSSFSPKAYLYARLRFLHRRLTHKTLRLYLGNLPGFYDAMDQQGVRYVVVRWAEEVPMAQDANASYDNDVDHLIEDDRLPDVIRLAAHFYGPSKADWYSATGQRGSSYLKMPYYPPAMAMRILDSRYKDDRGVWRPGKKEEFLSFAYHLCYHKGHRSGIVTGIDGIETGAAKRDYAVELQRLADEAAVTLPAQLTLLSLHQFLKSVGWNMPNDLMSRWPDQHRVLCALEAEDNAQRTAAIASSEQLTVFILRDDCETAEMEDIAREMIAQRFTILEEVRLTPEVKDRVVNQTRGGNWVEKYRKGIVWPTVAMICRNASEPGPLPINMSEQKLAKRYPHLSNTDVLIKRVIREKVKEHGGPDQHRVVLHATDNPAEAAEMLEAVLGPDAAAFLRNQGQA